MTDKEKSRMSWEDFSQAYCATQVSDPESLAKALAEKVDTYHPDGFMLLRCEVMDSSHLGQQVILPFGPNSTWKSLPNHPVSPRGLASDMSVVVGWLPVGDLPRKGGR